MHTLLSTSHAVVKSRQLARLKSTGLKKSLMRSVPRNEKISKQKNLKKAKIQLTSVDLLLKPQLKAKTFASFLGVNLEQV